MLRPPLFGVAGLPLAAGLGLLVSPEGECATSQHEPRHRRRQRQLHFPLLTLLGFPHHRHRPLTLGRL